MDINEAKESVWSNRSINSLSKVECDSLINKIYYEFEAQIAELTKPKSCGGCGHYDYSAGDCALLKYVDAEQQISFIEVAETFYCNQYEPKETK